MVIIAPFPIDDNKNTVESTKSLEFPDNRLLVDLCGEFDCNLSTIENTLGVQINRRGNSVMIHGNPEVSIIVYNVLGDLYRRLEQGGVVEHGDILGALSIMKSEQNSNENKDAQSAILLPEASEIHTRKKTVVPRTSAQKLYIQKLCHNELVFGLGPAGTGKTYLAVAMAVSMLIGGRVDRIILSRPAVEAGERLGFLPGDMKEKIDPYMQPLYDALHDFLPSKQLSRLMEDKQIEIAPLAFMRGRTLSNAFVVLDEAQNATNVQMKMFLTRLGEGSRMAITGDASQVDLPRGIGSGLVEAERILQGIKGVGFIEFTARDVVRHSLVARIIDAYDNPNG